MKHRVDPFKRENWEKPLWVVSGSLFYPRIFLVKIVPHPHNPGEGILWGWAMQDGGGGFRTLEKSLSTWFYSETSKGRNPRFYPDIKYALKRIRKLLTPIGVIQEMPKAESSGEVDTRDQRTDPSAGR